MPPRSKVEMLPDAVLAELNDRLVKGRFSGYVQLAAWLRAKGFEIGKSALGDYGKSFKDQLEALKIAADQARAVVNAAPDDEGAMNEALMRLIQEKLFKILTELQIDPKRLNVASLARSVAQLARASVHQKRYAREVREKAAAAADKAAAIAKKGGLSKAGIDSIKREILGIARQPQGSNP